MKLTARYKCKHEGCSEWIFSEYDSLKEMRSYHDKRQNWLCSRHSQPGNLLSLESLIKTTIFTNQEIMNSKGDSVLGRFFNGAFGFMSGPGFKVIAEDFPVGAKLKVTAEIILP